MMLGPAQVLKSFCNTTCNSDYGNSCIYDVLAPILWCTVFVIPTAVGVDMVRQSTL